MKYLFLLIAVTFTILLTPAMVQAQECERVGQCINNRTCIQQRDNEGNTVLVLGAAENCGSSSIGGVRPPTSVAVNNAIANHQNGQTSGGIGIIIFISNVLRLFAVIAGIWAMFNLIMGGYTFITSAGDAGATEKVRTSITMTVIGLAIIAGGYTIAALVGALMFGDPNFILQPQLQGALQ